MRVIPQPYIKVGRIPQNVAKVCHIKAADVLIDSNHIKHIYGKHNKELDQLGITPIDMVRLICTSFNEIRIGSHGSLLLIINDNVRPKVAAIEMNYVDKNEFWEVKTAQPRKVEAVKNKVLIWNAAHRNPVR